MNSKHQDKGTGHGGSGHAGLLLAIIAAVVLPGVPAPDAFYARPTRGRQVYSLEGDSGNSSSPQTIQTYTITA